MHLFIECSKWATRETSLTLCVCVSRRTPTVAFRVDRDSPPPPPPPLSLGRSFVVHNSTMFENANLNRVYQQPSRPRTHTTFLSFGRYGNCFFFWKLVVLCVCVWSVFILYSYYYCYCCYCCYYFLRVLVMTMRMSRVISKGLTSTVWILLLFPLFTPYCLVHFMCSNNK